MLLDYEVTSAETMIQKILKQIISLYREGQSHVLINFLAKKRRFYFCFINRNNSFSLEIILPAIQPPLVGKKSLMNSKLIYLMVYCLAS